MYLISHDVMLRLYNEKIKEKMLLPCGVKSILTLKLSELIHNNFTKWTFQI